MHRSRLAGFIIDCSSRDLTSAARFWSDALGMGDLGEEAGVYRRLDAEVARLEKLGARHEGKIKNWHVMEAPTGQRFCVVRARASLEGAAGATTWP